MAVMTKYRKRESKQAKKLLDINRVEIHHHPYVTPFYAMPLIQTHIVHIHIPFHIYTHIALTKQAVHSSSTHSNPPS
jgi:hypothetical protein